MKDTEFIFNPISGEWDMVRISGDENDSNILQYSICIGTSKDSDRGISDNMRCYDNLHNTTFDYEIENDGEYLVIALPIDCPIRNITSNGIGIPMREPLMNNDKIIYISYNQLKKGLIKNLLITINN